MQDEHMVFENDSIDLMSLLNVMQFHLEEEMYIQGYDLFNPGDECDSILFILEGKVRITILDENDKEFTLDYLQKGDIIGQKSILYSQQYGITATAINEVKVYKLKH